MRQTHTVPPRVPWNRAALQGIRDDACHAAPYIPSAPRRRGPHVGPDRFDECHTTVPSHAA